MPIKHTEKSQYFSTMTQKEEEKKEASWRSYCLRVLG
jgi:hypothetical protein